MLVSLNHPLVTGERLRLTQPLPYKFVPHSAPLSFAQTAIQENKEKLQMSEIQQMPEQCAAPIRFLSLLHTSPLLLFSSRPHFPSSLLF